MSNVATPPVWTRGITPSRAIATEICADLRAGEFLDQTFDRRVVPLDPRDRRWTRELVFGMLRKRGWIDALLEQRVRGGLGRVDDDIVDLLRLGAYQLLAMGSVPAYAAIAQTVELAKQRHGIGASKLVNAILRRIDREREQLDAGPATNPAELLAVKYSHPSWLVQRWLDRWGPEQTIRLLVLNNEEAPLIARPFGLVREQLEANLEAAGVDVGDAPLLSDSLLLSGAVTLAELGAFRQGLFFIQDPAATLVTRYAAIADGSTVADLCAAPGGKSIELSRSAGVVIAGDKSFGRLGRLLANRERLDASNIHALVADARFPAIRPVEVVLVDVPCTGTGTFRRHPDARWRIRVSDIPVMAAMQRTILSAAASAVKTGGLLVYSTCSLEPEENEEQIAAFLNANRSWKLEPPPDGAVPNDVLDSGMLRVLPQSHGIDGAFAARLRRLGQ